MKQKIKYQIQALKTGWYIWIFPLFAVVLSVWLLLDYYKQQGPTIKIMFDDAAGIQAEKTKVRFRGVPIGTVKDVYISPDQKDVVAEIILRKDAKQFAVDGSKFSLITPKVGLQGITGIETIFEGTYIAVLPGPAEAEEKTVFKAQSSTGATDTLDDTSSYLLETANVESINANDAVSYRGLKVGSVTKLILTKDAQTIWIQINIENRYVRLIRTNTVFWRKVGVQAQLGLFHSEFKMNSFDSIMNGGVEFSTPNTPGPIAKAQHKFPILGAPPKDVEKWNPKLE